MMNSSAFLGQFGSHGTYVAVLVVGLIAALWECFRVTLNKQLCKKRTKLSLSGILAALCLFLNLPNADADDIAVFTSGAGMHKPNILFVLDFSGSMASDVYGNSTSGSGLPSRESILKSAVSQMLDQNETRINAGLSIYQWASSGIKWPVSDLSALANAIDPSIPAASGLTAKDIMKSILNNASSGSNTGTVGALAEAALYYRGGNVTQGGMDPSRIDRFKPSSWNTTTNQYEGGYYLSANPVTYTPQDAYRIGEPSPVVSYCRDYTIGGTVAGAWNECASLAAINCVYQAATPGTEPDDSTESAGYTSNAAHNRCEYTYPDTWQGAQYSSPIADACQQNIIVLISDGVPTSRWSFPELKDVLGKDESSCANLASTIFASSGSTSDEGNCGPEVAEALRQNDQIDSIDNSYVTTYTVGFNVDGAGQNYLKAIADAGGGLFLNASQPDELSAALDEIINDILGNPRSFASLSIDVDRANFSDDNRVYFPLFAPSLQRGWQGNLKGYFVDQDGIKDINNTIATVADGTGTRFADTAQSFWSDSVDGNDVQAGGASSRLHAASRNLYTFTGTTIPTLGIALSQPDNAHDLTVANTALTADMLGVSGDAAMRESIINWLHDAPMGDPLHSKSVAVRYANQNVAYIMTNQGLIHAFDATSPTDPTAGDTNGGQELFAFMPQELLPNIKDLQANGTVGQHIYGLDGGITRWHEDANKDGIVNDSDTVTLIFGMRRGGNNYYALDVTNPTNPKLKWMIKGGQGDFAQLAQSWSRMALISVLNNGVKERVLIFAGGYDAAVLDSVSTNTPALGNSVYMVDGSGNKIWSATHTDMIYSIPSNITPIDSDDNEIADRLYFGDTGGQVWRVDIGDIGQSNAFTINKLADFGGGAYQPFFYAPSVSLAGSSTEPYLAIVLGSGDRTKPLDPNSANRFYMVKDNAVNTGAPTGSWSTRNLNDLYNATANDLGSSNATTASQAYDALENANGWYINLGAGEKSLSVPITFQGQVLATTFSPLSTGNSNVCAAPGSVARYYAMDLVDAQPVVAETDGSGSSSTSTSAGRDRIITVPGIPSEPSIVVSRDGSVLSIVGQEVVDNLDSQLQRVYWHPTQ